MRDDSQNTPFTNAAQIADGRGAERGAESAQATAVMPTAAPDPQDGGARADATPTTGQTPPTQHTLLRTVYEENLTAVYRFVYSKVGNREEAEDLTSQVFIKALRGIDQARDAQTIQRWLFQVARTTVADHWRAFYRLPSRSLDDLLAAGWEGPREPSRQATDTPDDAMTVDAHTDGVATSGVAVRAQRILAQLPARYRDVLTYRFLLSYSLKETAAQMNLTEANVKVLQFRALKKASQIEEGTQNGAKPSQSSQSNQTSGGASVTRVQTAPPTTSTSTTASTASPDESEFSPL